MASGARSGLAFCPLRSHGARSHWKQVVKVASLPLPPLKMIVSRVLPDIADSLENVGLHHHHYPCQASMGIDPLYGDTLMHISGNIMKDALREALGDDLEVPTVRPAGYVEE